MKLPTSFQKIWAFTVRNAIVNRRNVFAVFEMLFWPLIGIFSVGLLTRFLHLKEDTVSFILIGAVTMNTVQIAQLDLSYALLYSVWSKSLKHEFIAPVRLSHILIGSGLVGLVRGLLVFGIMAWLSVYLFKMELGKPGVVGLIWFLVGMFLNSAIIGALVLALVLRFGQRAEVAAWAFSYLMLLLCGLYYPISVLPQGFQFLAQLIPLTYFLDYFRHFYGFPMTFKQPLLYGFGQSVLYLILSYGLVLLTLRSAYKRGILLRLSE
ncbi:MAG TPA: ABC transporter permease [Desulfobaccales bacterium]|nr:ABC transporter permease [Desulfobaccales bacterium]